MDPVKRKKEEQKLLYVRVYNSAWRAGDAEELRRLKSTMEYVW
jgi:hypothetical protein